MAMVRNDMARLIAERALPSITRWHRVEGIPRTHQFDRALRADVRDALWMLTRQWQMGEFKGDDAGSPVFAKLHLGRTKLTTYRPGDRPEQPFDARVPLEDRVEQRPVPFTAASQALSLDIRVVMGRQWQKMLAAKNLDGYIPDFRAAFRVEQPNPAAAADAMVVAHRDAWQHFAAFATRVVDGYLWYRWVVDHPAPRDLTTLPAPLNIDPGDVGPLNDLADAFVGWFDRLIDQPVTPDENAWDVSRLEYRFGCSAPLGATARKDLVASEYYQGDLDWHALDVAPASNAAPVDPAQARTVTTTFIPTAVEFNGMANTRWWSFEDRRVNFGGITPDTTDIAKLLLMEFGLLYANDWCTVPVPLESGDVAQVLGLAVTNVFGERIWIEPAGAAPGQQWQQWSLFSLSPADATVGTRDRALLLLPTVPKVQEGAPLEEITLIRDEMANMVWGIELTVPMPHGEGRSGGSAAAETTAFFARLFGAGPGEPPLENEAKARYELMNTVPEHWIPFIPVHVPGNSREIQLQRASMLRVVDEDPTHAQKIKPRTSLLREGLDAPIARRYFVFEEEVPRAGVRVRQGYQRTRWTDGRVFVWYGASKKAGRGEGSSGLEFDRLIEVKKNA